MKTKEYLLKLDEESKTIMYYYGSIIEEMQLKKAKKIYLYFLYTMCQIENACRDLLVLENGVNELFNYNDLYMIPETVKEDISCLIDLGWDNASAKFDIMIEDSSLFQFLDPILDTTKPSCLENILKAILEDAKKRKFGFIDELECEELIEELDEIIDEYQQDQEEKREEDYEYHSTSNSLKSKLEYGTILTEQHFQENPLYGRKDEFRNMCAFLMDEEKSLILYGNQGVGKTTLVKGLAYQIQKGTAPITFQRKSIVEMSATEMVSGTKYRGDMEEKMLNIIDVLIQHGNSILFIDEIHMLMGAGTSVDSNQVDISNILKPYLGDGRLKIIGATTTQEYEIIKSNGAFARRFNGIEIKEQAKEEVIEILNHVIEKYQKKRNISFFDDIDLRKIILEEILTISEKRYQNAGIEMYSPDLPLTILRNAYNYALLDAKKSVDSSSLFEGIDHTVFINEEGKKYFKAKIAPHLKH